MDADLSHHVSMIEDKDFVLVSFYLFSFRCCWKRSFICLFEHQLFLLEKGQKGDMWSIVSLFLLDVMERNNSIALVVHRSSTVLSVYIE